MLDIKKALDTDSGSVLIPERLDPMLVELADKLLVLRQLFKTQPWDTNSFEWNERSAIITGEFYNEDDTHTENKSTFGRKQAPIKMIKGEGAVSNLLVQTSKRYLNALQAEIESATKGMTQAEENAYINGDSSTDADSFDGLKKLITNTLDCGGTITFDKLDEGVQNVVDNGGVPGLILLAGRDKLELQRLLRAKGQIAFDTLEVKAGLKLASWQNIPILTSTYMSASLPVGSTPGTNSIAFIIDLGNIVVPEVLAATYEEVKSTKDAIAFRVKQYKGFAVKGASKKHLQITGITKPS